MWYFLKLSIGCHFSSLFRSFVTLGLECDRNATVSNHFLSLLSMADNGANFTCKSCCNTLCYSDSAKNKNLLSDYSLQQQISSTFFLPRSLLSFMKCFLVNQEEQNTLICAPVHVFEWLLLALHISVKSKQCARLMHISMVCPRMRGGGGGGNPREFDIVSSPRVGILTSKMNCWVRNLRGDLWHLTFTRFPGVGDSTLDSTKFQIPLGLPPPS